jgi:AAA+ ATPase superfamily predicted ATPase
MEKLREIILSQKAELVLLYGRRRVGKSTILVNIANETNSIYFLSDSSKTVLDNLSRQITDSFVKFSHWDDFFEFILKSTYEVIIIDEFQYLYDNDKSWPTILQRWWEKIKTTNKKIILCGSIISTIYRIATGYSSPLYGRKTRELEVKPLSYTDVKHFFPRSTNEDLVRTYAILGGIPRYLQEFDPKRTVMKNIENSILDRTSFLYNEPMNLLYEEFREPGTYISILLAITQGHNKFSDISVFSKIGTNVLTSYLSVLERVRIIEKSIPVTERRIKAKNTRYAIKDQFYLFWFKFIFYNQSLLERGMTNVVMKSILKDFNAFVGRSFENICKEYLIQSNIFSFTNLGSWWFKDNEIDIVATNESSNEILFGECKWKTSVDSEKILKDLKLKAKSVDWNLTRRKEKYVIFAKTFTKRILDDDLFLISLDDIFSS